MKIFSLDSPVMVFLTKVANLMILNILVIICSLPIVTGGASITAMYYVALKMARDEDPYIFRNFVKGFKDNFKQATIIWLILLVIASALYLDWKIVTTAMTGTMATVMEVIMLVLIVVVAIIALYIFPVISRFENTIKASVKNALLMSLINLPKTVWMLLIHLLPVLAILISANMVPVVFMLGFATVAYLCSRTLVKIFKKYEPEEDPVPGEDEYVPLSFMVEEEEAKKAALELEENAEIAGGTEETAGEFGEGMSVIERHMSDENDGISADEAEKTAE